jgi:hypothetical protein
MSTNKVILDWEKIGEMLRAGISGEQCAARLGIHSNTLYVRCKEETGFDFVTFRAEKRAEGDAFLLEKQYEIAYKEGDKTMLIWLGKQRLDQKDRAHNEVSTPQGEKILIEIYDPKKAEGNGSPEAS